MQRRDFLAATTDWRLAAELPGLRIVRGPGFGGWMPAGTGHAYRSEEPRTSVCGRNLDGFHHWPDAFDDGTFERCAECSEYLAKL